MSDYATRPAFPIAAPRARRRAPSFRLGRIVRDAAAAFLRARARRRDMADLATLPDEALMDVGLLGHPEIVRARARADRRRRIAIGSGDGGR